MRQVLVSNCDSIRGKWIRWRVFWAIFLCLALAGCFAIPVAPYTEKPTYGQSRANLSDSAAASIIPGKTTRSDVLLSLGPPDVAAVDESWFFYESDFLKKQSGVWLVVGFPGGGAVGRWPLSSAMLFRRLYVTFTDKGIVATSESSEEECQDIHNWYAEYKTYPPTPKDPSSCRIMLMSKDMRERRLLERLLVADPVAKSPHTRFDDARWVEKHFLEAIVLGVPDCTMVGQRSGSLFVSRSQVTFLEDEKIPAGKPPESMRMHRKDVTATFMNTWLVQGVGVALEEHDGFSAAFTFCSGNEINRSEIRRLYSELKSGDF